MTKMFQTDWVTENFGSPIENYIPDYAYFLGSLIKLTKRKIIVEIGVGLGQSTYIFCLSARQCGGNVYGFDFWQIRSLQQVDQILKELKCDNYILHNINTQTQEFKTLIQTQFESIDFAFIDGDHSYSGVCNDFFTIYPKLADDGIIALHDTVTSDGCREFIFDLRTKFYDGTYDIIDIPFGYNTRRVGLSLLVKRAMPNITFKHKEDNDGSPHTFEQIKSFEKEWYNAEVEKYKKEISGKI